MNWVIILFQSPFPSDSTIRFLGIVHFAGTTHGKSSLLCDQPLTYPHLVTAAVPLFLSVVSSLHSTCPMSHQFIPASCWNAMEAVQHAVSFANLTVRYNPGRGRFLWPPNDFIKMNKSASSL